MISAERVKFCVVKVKLPRVRSSQNSSFGCVENIVATVIDYLC